jgi:cell pole-organizing protein PopZ
MIRWPIVEGSLTSVPANLYATVAARSAQEHYEAAGLPVDDAIRAVWSQADQDKLPNSSFAYVEPNAGDDKSKRHLPYKDADGKPDAAHVRAGLSRLDQTDIPAAAKASAKKKLEAAAKELGIETASATKSADVAAMRADPMGDDDDDDVGTDERSFEDICSDLDALLNPMYSPAYTRRLDTFPTHVLVQRYEYDSGMDDDSTYWDIPYTIGANLEPVLGTPVQVEHKETYTPVARAAELPIGFDAQLVIRHVSTFAGSTEDYGERRFREGRMLSASNLQTISDAADGLEGHAKKLRDLHAKASAQKDDAARAALFSDPEWVRVQLKLLELATV